MDKVELKRPLAHVEGKLIDGIVGGEYAIGSALPAERMLAEQLGVTRSTLREALRGLQRDGWVTVHQGKPTVVNDIWRDGQMNIIQSLVSHGGKYLPEGFVEDLLWIRLDLAPSYAQRAARRDALGLAGFFAEAKGLEDTAAAYAAFDWRMHRAMTLASGNPIYTLFLNGFAGFYEQTARMYFAKKVARERSQLFYESMQDALIKRDDRRVRALVTEMMEESIVLWKQTSAP